MSSANKYKSVNNMKIPNSKRLSFSMMNRDDTDIMFQIDQDPEVMRYINGGKMTSREDVQNIYIPRMESYANPKKGWGLWKITNFKDDEVIGFVLVRPMAFFTDLPEYKNIELGWRFIQKSWGKGYATEAAESVKSALVENSDVEMFTAIALEGNIGSIKIMKKLGMKYVKTDIHKDPLGDNEVVYYQMVVEPMLVK
jgi:RimJ/RimL family protein N-acetyltransferase